MKYHTDKPDAAMERIARTAFGYNGRKYEIRTGTTFNPNDNHWSGGSRTYIAAVNRSTMEVVSLPQAGTAFDPETPSSVEIPPGVLIVEHVIFCGKDLGVRFIVRPDEAAALIPATQSELSPWGLVILAYTRGRVSSYNGFKRVDMAYQDTLRKYGKASAAWTAQWEQHKAALVGKGLLNKAGAITPDGQNALESALQGIDKTHEASERLVRHIAEQERAQLPV
jgi:hypothetical protein